MIIVMNFEKADAKADDADACDAYLWFGNMR